MARLRAAVRGSELSPRADARAAPHRAPTRRIFKMTRVRLQQLFGRLERKGPHLQRGDRKRDTAGVEKVGRAGKDRTRPQAKRIIQLNQSGGDFTDGPSPLLSELTPAELLARGAEYRAMTTTASTEDVRDALIRLAEAHEELAGNPWGFRL